MKVIDRRMDKSMRDYEKKLLHEISNEHFSLKKLVHLYELKYLSESEHSIF